MDGRAKRAWGAYNAAEREAAAGEGRGARAADPADNARVPPYVRLSPDRHRDQPQSNSGRHGALEDSDDFDVYGHLLPGSYDDIRAWMDAYLAAKWDPSQLGI